MEVSPVIKILLKHSVPVRNEIRFLSRSEMLCSNSTSTSNKFGHDGCISNYLEKKIGCRMPWANQGANSKPECTEQKQMKDYQKELR